MTARAVELDRLCISSMATGAVELDGFRVSSMSTRAVELDASGLRCSIPGDITA